MKWTILTIAIAMLLIPASFPVQSIAAKKPSLDDAVEKLSKDISALKREVATLKKELATLKKEDEATEKEVTELKKRLPKPAGARPTFNN